MLISHRRSAYVDTDELERAAGKLEARINAGTMESTEQGAFYMGAATALRLMQRHDIKEAQGLVLLVDRSYELVQEGRGYVQPPIS